MIFLFTPVARIAGVETVNLDSRCELEAFYDRYAAIPEEMLHNRQLPDAATGEVGVGERGAGCVIGPPAYVKIPMLSVLSAMFLHGSWLHLLGNMLFLCVFGNNIEDRLGGHGTCCSTCSAGTSRRTDSRWPTPTAPRRS